MLKVQLQLILFTSYSTSANSTYKEHTVLSAYSMNNRSTDLRALKATSIMQKYMHNNRQLI